MFITDVVDEVKNGSEAIIQNYTKAWKKFDTSGPYFQITESKIISGELEEIAVFIADPYELGRLAIISRLVNHTDIGEVRVSTPSSINLSGTWLHDTLLAMYVAVHKLTKKTGLVYVTSGGTYGVEPSIDLNMYYKEVIYQSPKHPIDAFDDYIDRRRAWS